MLNQLRLLRDVSAIVLIAATWRLWFAVSDFPPVPFFSFLTSVPRFVDPILSGVLISALLVDVCLIGAGIVRGSVSPRGLCVAQVCESLFVVMATGLILLNQHCLQPWMYHLLILTPLLWQRSPVPVSGVGSSGSGGLIQNQSSDLFSHRAILWLTASIYVWSAWSKLDASFLQSHGPKFVSTICDVVGISTRFWTDRTWQIAAAMLPVGELIVGIGLLFPRTRNAALWSSLMMHGVLILAVGPWGLNHRAGVLLWNGYFIIQNLVLLRATQKPGATAGLPGATAVLFRSESTVITKRRVPVLFSQSPSCFPRFGQSAIAIPGRRGRCMRRRRPACLSRFVTIPLINFPSRSSSLSSRVKSMMAGRGCESTFGRSMRPVHRFTRKTVFSGASPGQSPKSLVTGQAFESSTKPRPIAGPENAIEPRSSAKRTSPNSGHTSPSTQNSAINKPRITRMKKG